MSASLRLFRDFCGLGVRAAEPDPEKLEKTEKAKEELERRQREQERDRRYRGPDRDPGDWGR